MESKCPKIRGSKCPRMGGSRCPKIGGSKCPKIRGSKCPKSKCTMTLPSGSQTSSTAKLPLYTFYSNELENSDMIIVSVMGDGKESSAASHHNSFGLVLLSSVLYLSFS